MYQVRRNLPVLWIDLIVVQFHLLIMIWPYLEELSNIDLDWKFSKIYNSLVNLLSSPLSFDIFRISIALDSSGETSVIFSSEISGSSFASLTDSLFDTLLASPFAMLKIESKFWATFWFCIRLGKASWSVFSSPPLGAIIDRASTSARSWFGWEFRMCVLSELFLGIKLLGLKSGVTYA